MADATFTKIPNTANKIFMVSKRSQFMFSWLMRYKANSGARVRVNPWCVCVQSCEPYGTDSETVAKY